MVRRVSQSKYKPKICPRAYRVGFGSEPTDHEHFSSAVESKGISFRALVTEPIVASAILGRPQSINLAEGGQAA